MKQVENTHSVPPHCVLVLEDDSAGRELIRFQLELLGYDSEAYANAEEGFEQWRSKRHSFVITDCNLPGMSGFDLATVIRVAEHGGKSRTTVVGISGYSLDYMQEKCRDSGMDHCLAKPVLLSDIDGIFPERVSGAVAGRVAEDLDYCHDGAALRSLVGDNRDKCRGLLVALVNSLNNGIRDLNNAHQSSSASALNAAAHKLKSSALAVGANLLADLCQQTEDAGRLKDWHGINTIRPKLQAAAASLMQDTRVLVDDAMNTVTGDKSCPLMTDSYRPFRSHCGQCAYRMEQPA